MFSCEKCNFFCSLRGDWKRHLTSNKHILHIQRENDIFNDFKKKHQQQMIDVFREIILRNVDFSNKYSNLAITGNWHVDGSNKECKLCNFKCHNVYRWLEHTNSEKHIYIFNYFKLTFDDYDKMMYKLHQDYQAMM